MEQSRREIVVGTVGDLAPGTTRKFLLPTVGSRPRRSGERRRRGARVGEPLSPRRDHDGLGRGAFPRRRAAATSSAPTHGALYEPDSGRCVSGPPFGRFLIRVPLRIEGDRLIAAVPDEL
jgi:hypothetical protein